MKLGSIYISVRAKISKLKRDLAKAKGMTEKTAVLMKKAISNISFAKVGVAAAAFSAAYVYGMKKAIDAASDLQEVQSKFDVVFKEHREQAEDMAKVLVDAYAMSTREAKQYMSSIQDLLVPMGMMSDKALLMSNEVVKLAADLGSFNNLPTATVMLDIQSALVGNFETMKKYGVILNETVIKQKALDLGMWNGKGMVDANTKAQIAYKLMLEGSAAAIGDQELTMGNYANQMKKLKANVEDIAAAIGDELLPQVTAWVNRLNEMIKQNPQIIKDIGEFAKKTLALAETMAIATYKVLSFGKAVLEVTGILGMLEHATMIGRYGASGSWMEEGEEALKKYEEALNKNNDSIKKIVTQTNNLNNAKKELALTAKQLATLEAETFEWLEKEFLMHEKNAEVFKEQQNKMWETRLQYAQMNLQTVKDFEANYKQSTMSTHAYEISLIDDMAEKYIAAGADRISVERWVAGEIKKIDDQSLADRTSNIQKKIQATAKLFSSLSSLMSDFTDLNTMFGETGAEQSRKDFQRQRAFGIVSTTISTAEAVAGALAVKPWTYMNAVNAIAAGALGTIQTAIIAKQKYAYAKGGIFTNSIVDRPTMFNNSVMGEKGPEAIVPLSEGPGGELGIKNFGGQGDIYNYYQVTAMDAQSVSEVLRRNPNAVTQVMTEQMQRGNSALNSNIRRVAR